MAIWSYERKRSSCPRITSRGLKYEHDQSKPMWMVVATVEAESKKEAKNKLSIRSLCGNERMRKMK